MENSEWLKEDDEQRMLKECYEDGEYAAFNRGEMLTVLSRLAAAYRKLAERDRQLQVYHDMRVTEVSPKDTT